MDGYHYFYISIQIIEKLQGNFVEENKEIIFALGVEITNMAKVEQKKVT